MFLVSDLSSFSTFFTVESAKPDDLACCPHLVKYGWISCENTLSCFCAALLRCVLSSQSETVFVFLLQTLLFCGGLFCDSLCLHLHVSKPPWAKEHMQDSGCLDTDRQQSWLWFYYQLTPDREDISEGQSKVNISVPFESAYLYNDNRWICKYSESRRLI